MNISDLTITYRSDDEARYACFTIDGRYSEVPAPLEISEQDHIAIVQSRLKDICMADAYSAFTEKTTLSDDVYCEGVVVRADRPLDEVSLTEDEMALVPVGASQPIAGRYTGYRPPYSGAGLSIYDQRQPPQELLARLNKTASDFAGGLHNWYAIKKDDATGTIFYKLVENYDDSHGGPVFPEHSDVIWTAKIYRENGEADKNVDFFVVATKETMQDWCNENSAIYPLPQDESRTPWIFGIVWDSEADTVTAVKAYIPIHG